MSSSASDPGMEATKNTDLSLGCPGNSDAERQAFLSAAFERLPKPLADSVPIGFRTFAWRYGLALHDVERLRRSSPGDRSHEQQPNEVTAVR